MEFNFSNAPRDREEYNERIRPGASAGVGWSPKSPLGVVLLVVGILAVGAFAYFNSGHQKPLVSSGVTEDLKIERVDPTRINYDKKFRNTTVQNDFGTFLWTSDLSGPCEPVITKATWDRAGGFVTLTKTGGTGCLLSKKTFQQRISPADGSKFPSGTRIVWDKPAG
jgi:hypothetical protein